MTQSFEADSAGKPQRHRVNVPMELHPGDMVDFVTQARGNHDCDGLFLIDVQVRVPSCEVHSGPHAQALQPALLPFACIQEQHGCRGSAEA